MSMFTQRMKMLTAVVMDKDRERVVKALLEKGVMEFVHISELPEDKLAKLSSHPSAVSKTELQELRVRIEAMLREGGMRRPQLSGADIKSLPAVDTEAYDMKLKELSAALEEIRNRQQEVNRKINFYSEIVRYGRDKGGRDYLDFRAGDISHSAPEDLQGRLESIGGIFLFSSSPLASLTLRRDSKAVSSVMDKFGWIETTDVEAQKQLLKDALLAAEEKLNETQSELMKLQAEAKDKIQSSKEELSVMWQSVRMEELCEHVESFFSFTSNTALFSGWVPAGYADDITEIITEASGGKCVIEWTEDEDIPREEVPVSMHSHPFFAPFRRMVDNYGVPEYGSVNPTVFTTIAYLSMFALMFADVGQGLVLFLIGLLGTRSYQKNPMKKDGILSRYLCKLLMYLGPASMVGGVLFGSYFGLSLLPALWFPFEAIVQGHEVTYGPVRSIYGILAVTIYFGIAVIYTGLILNWVNLFRKKRYFDLVFDKNGLVGGVLYGIGIWFAYGFVQSGYRTFPSATWFYAVLLVCIALIFIKVPVGTVINKMRGKEIEGIGKIITDTIMEFIVQALETFSGLLSNTLSFMRVAGLGIAHASLMSAFYQMAGMTPNLVTYVLIAIVGNLLVLVLEGLSAGIQSLRLNYYEFFTKYFTGRGIAFNPIGLESRIQVDRY